MKNNDLTHIVVNGKEFVLEKIEKKYADTVDLIVNGERIPINTIDDTDLQIEIDSLSRSERVIKNINDGITHTEFTMENLDGSLVRIKARLVEPKILETRIPMKMTFKKSEGKTNNEPL